MTMRMVPPMQPGVPKRCLVRSALAAAMVLALLLVQHAAWRHGLAHDVPQVRSFSSIAAASDGSAGQGHEPDHAACALCLAFAQAAWAAPTLPSALPPPRVAEGPPAPARFVPGRARPLPFTPIRGPPGEG